MASKRPKDMTDEQHHAFLKDDNEARIAAVVKRTSGQITLEGSFDSLRATTYLKHLCVEMGVLDRADFDFEGKRSEMLDKIEASLTEQEEAFAKAQEEAKKQAALATLQGRPPGVPGMMPPPVPITRPKRA